MAAQLRVQSPLRGLWALLILAPREGLRRPTMTNVNQAPLPRLSKRRWYVLRLLSGAISSTWLYLFYLYVCRIFGTGEARNFKFGTCIELGKSHLKYDKMSPKGAWSRFRAEFLNFKPPSVNLEPVKLTSNFVYG